MNTNTLLHPWRAIYWEPVQGTGERLTVGVLHCFDGTAAASRIIRDDVLDSLYGSHASAGARRLIDTALDLYVKAAEVGGIAATDMPLLGLYAGPLRETGASTLGDLLRTAALLYSSLSNIDRFDELEESDEPQPEEVNRRFGTEVRDLVIARRPDLAGGFNRTGALINGGQLVRFGYFTPALVAHFSVLHPVRQGPSVRDARARLWELERAVSTAGIKSAALITAIPRQDDATLGEKQRASAKANERSIEQEADAAHIRLYPVCTADEGALRLIEAADAA